MNHDDIVRMAREAANGMLSYDAEGNWRLSESEVYRFAELVKQHIQIEQMAKFEELANIVRMEERHKIIDILLRLHERAADSHNHYLYAVNVIEGKI
jgi:hypothetical protein